MCSIPVLNRHTVINRAFDTDELLPTHNDMAAMLGRMEFSDERPSFYLLNVGETHYPYALPDEDPSNWPRISGVHGVFKHLGQPTEGAPTEPREFFDQGALKELRSRQINAVG